MSVKKVSILGTTGSVGNSTADVIRLQPELFEVIAVTAQTNVDALAAQAIALKARHAVIGDESLYGQLKDALSGSGIEIAAGRKALLEAAGRKADIVMAAIVGFAGLEPVIEALKAGANVALANKEPLVAAGPQVVAAARQSGSRLLPVDSEHNAVFQVFDEQQRAGIERIILTASGGPFRTWDLDRIAKATPEQAVAHPNWSMGRKISVDSASMMNKALEVIEARYLFDTPLEKIDVVVHPQSIVHSMVEYSDGSVLAQMGAPDMKTPIAYCLGWPERIPSGSPKLDFMQKLNFEFEPLDNKKFPAVGLAYECLKAGQAACVAFNAANELAVAAFLEKRIDFVDIVGVITHILENVGHADVKSVEDVVSFDETVRQQAQCQIDRIYSKHKVRVA